MKFRYFLFTYLCFLSFYVLQPKLENVKGQYWSLSHSLATPGVNVKGRPCLLIGRFHFFCVPSPFSDRNSPCCRNCMFEKGGTRCQEAISATCKGTSACTGVWLQLMESSTGLSQPSEYLIIYSSWIHVCPCLHGRQ